MSLGSVVLHTCVEIGGEDGDAGDILAMLMDVPDGTSVPVCIAGRTGGASFQCCDTIEVRNRGLRDLPRGLIPPSSP